MTITTTTTMIQKMKMLYLISPFYLLLLTTSTSIAAAEEEDNGIKRNERRRNLQQQQELEFTFNITINNNTGIEDNDIENENNNDIFDIERRTIVTNQAMGARCAVSADFNGDGLLDIVSASSNDNAVSWYENLGLNSESGQIEFSIKKQITWSSLGSRIVTVADIDGDGDIDVIGASYYDSSLRWYENIDGNGTFIEHLISNGVNEGQGVTVADLNNDGLPDIISASSGDNTIAVFKNLGSSSSNGKNNDNGNGGGTYFCEIKEIVDDNAIGARTVKAADLNGDGYIDLASASKDDDTIAWYPNDGTGHFPTKLIISSGIESQGAYSLVIEDIDQDGDLDIIVASNGNDHVSLWRNEGDDGKGNIIWKKTLIYDNADFVLSVTAIDFDKDGDIDIASASFFDGHINWYENVDGYGRIWKNHTIYVGIQGHYVSTGDIDGDGDDDLIAVTHAENTVAVYYAQTLCDGSNNGQTKKDCCYPGTQWNGTACETCPYGTYGEGYGTNAKCIKCPRGGDDDQRCVIPGHNVIPATCAGINTGCADVDTSISKCVCEANTMKDPITDACIACPEGQIRPDDDNPDLFRSIDSLGNYSIWESQQGICYVPEEETNPKTLPWIIAIVVVVGVFVLAVIGFVWRQKTLKATSIALFTIDPDEIQYDQEDPIIGRGAFGIVMKGRYRGTEVAIKRALPPEGKPRSIWKRSSSSSSSLSSSAFFVKGGGGGSNNKIITATTTEKMTSGGDSDDHGSTTRNDVVLTQEDNDPVLMPENKLSEVIEEDREQPLNDAVTTTDDIEEGVIAAFASSTNYNFDNPGHQSTISSNLGLQSHLSVVTGTKILSKTARYRKMRSDFIAEMRIVTKLRHPNITTTMGAILSPGEEPMLVMEYMHNGSLYDAIRDDSLDLNSREDILTIVQDIAHGLRFLHSANPPVIHGDLKAKNVLIDSNFRAKVADFGMCARTSSGGARGTPFWMAPELLLQESSNTTMSDMYAFGILLYEVYSKQNPYEGEDYQTVLQEICDPSISKRPPVPTLCPANVAALYKNCLEGDPNLRPTAQNVDAELQAEGTIQGRVFRIEALNRELAENNRRITSEQSTQLAHFASMSHEIRTPLNCIIGVSSLLEDDKHLEASQLDLVKMIVSSGKLLRHVVDDVLDFSKLISGNAEIDIKRTDLQFTLNNIATSMKLSPITERKHISIQTFYDPNVPQFVETDERRLQQILYNLLSNAVKFSNEESTIDLSVSVVGGSDDNSEEHQLQDLSSSMRQKLRISRQKLRISVKDYGKGIKESDFEKIFQPFQQTETGITCVDGGTGLGLAITKQLTELLGGTISVDSTLGEWTEFSLSFPLTGIPVNKLSIASKLSQCCVWLVSNNEWEIQSTVEVCRYFNIQCLPFENLAALSGCLAPFGTDSVIACLVQEDLYDDSGYKTLSKKAKTVLVTFGPNGKVDKSQLHYQSLQQVFPSVLMRQLISLCDGKDPSKIHATRRLSDKTTETSGTVSYEHLKILVAEDNKVNQKVLRRLLERLGVTDIQIVSNGQLAIELEEEESFDIIFMDIQMPVLDGIEACKRITAKYNNDKENARNSNADEEEEEGNDPPKIVFLSAHVLDDYESMCMDNGATDYMTKPCTLQDVREKLFSLTAL